MASRSSDIRSIAPRLSIALCTYNGARFLRSQLDTIAAQTLAPFELVVGDDQSDDETVAILDRFAREVPFAVRVVRNPVRLGAAGNFAACIARCRGDVVVLSDQDDLWFPNRLARTAAAFADDPNVALTFSDAPLVDARGAEIGRGIFASVPISRADRARLNAGTDLFPLILRYGVLYGATMAFRADLVELILPIPAGWSQDEWISLVAAASGRSIRLDPVIRYRQHAGQVVGAGNARLATTLKSARDRGGDHYQRDLDRYATAVASVRDRPALRERLLPALSAKLAFLRDRRSIHKRGRAAFPALVRLALGRGYSRYAGGIRSLAKDALVLLGVHRGGAA